MRRHIVLLIWLRELRDQLRDRRTLFVMVVLPLLIYPLGGYALTQIALGSAPKRLVVGIHGAEHLPGGADDKQHAFPPLIVDEDGRSHFPSNYFGVPDMQHLLEIKLLADDERTPLDRREIDVMLVIPPDFRSRLESKTPVPLVVYSRSDEASRQASGRLYEVLGRWQAALKSVRFARSNLPLHFDQPFHVEDETAAGGGDRRPMGDVFGLLTRIFPFVLVLWSLAGALYPAVDLCAGEKERGTMETLLISPASREEIVWGKFLTIWVFSGVTALLNLASMAVTSWSFSNKFAAGTLNMASFAWCVVLLLPLSAFFSALCLAVGAYARSTKGGQYYLMPLFVVVMPLVFLTLVPGVELNPFYSMVPVTGVSLLLQNLIQAGRPDPALWLYFVPVLVPMVIYSWLALRWAIIQFQREEVLFREAETIEVRLWLRRLLRERETRPSAGQALFCFTVVLGLSWFSLGLGSELLATNIIRFLAFVAAPTLLMSFLLTTEPRQSLAVRMPPPWAWPFSLALVVLLTPPLLELTVFLLRINPNLERLIQQYRPFVEYVHSLSGGNPENGLRWWQAFVVFAVLPAVCEELTFRGFILTGLQRRFRPRTAVLLSSFLFSLMHMNVFQFVPTFLVGVVLAYLTTRCGSLLPAMLFHVLYNSMLLLQAMIWPGEGKQFLLQLDTVPRLLLVGVCAVLGGALCWWLTLLRPHPEYATWLQSDPGLEPPTPRPSESALAEIPS